MPTEVSAEDAATLRESLPAESQTVASTLPAAETDAVPAACVEAANAGFQFAEGVELDEAGCRAVAGAVAGPFVPALPGFPGFDVRDTGDRFRKRLIDEPDSPTWSRSMETRIYNEIGQHLADALGFNGYRGGHAVPPEVGTGFTCIYLGDWITERPDPDAPPRTFPASFEEIRDSLTSDPGDSPR